MASAVELCCLNSINLIFLSFKHEIQVSEMRSVVISRLSKGPIAINRSRYTTSAEGRVNGCEYKRNWIY